MGVAKKYRFGCGSQEYNPNLYFFGNGFVEGTGNGPTSYSMFSFGFGVKRYDPYQRRWIRLLVWV
jgi:hypothetical protein